MRHHIMARLAWSYERVSSGGQLDGDGLARQSSLFLPFCERHGLQPAPQRLRDAGVSAYKGAHRRRGELGRFLDDARRGGVPEGSVLVLEDLDRFSREAATAAEQLLLDLFNAGLALGIVRDDRVVDRAAYDSDLTLRLMFVIRRDAAHDYSAKLSGRIAAAWSSEVDRIATGRKVARLRPFWCDYDETTGDFRLNQHADLVRLIVQLAIDGMGAERIAKELNRRGIRTVAGQARRGGLLWRAGNVNSLLQQRFLVGEATVKRKGQADLILPGYLPPVLSTAEWDALQAGRAARCSHRGRIGRGGQVHNILQSLLYCSCGDRLSFTRKKSRGKVYDYLRCLSNAETCDVRFIRYDEDALLRGLVSERWRDYFHQPGDNRKRRELQTKLRDAERQQAEAEGKAERSRANLSQLLGDGVLDAAMARQLTGAAAEHDRLAVELARSAAVLRAQLQGLSARSGRDLEAELQQRVQDFMVVGRHDPGERSRLNSWLMLQGFRADLVDPKRARFRWGTVEMLGRNPLTGEHEVVDHAGGVVWLTPDGRDYWTARAEALEDAARG